MEADWSLLIWSGIVTAVARFLRAVAPTVTDARAIMRMGQIVKADDFLFMAISLRAQLVFVESGLQRVLPTIQSGAHVAS